MAFPIVPRRRSGATGFPTTLGLGELAVNTLAGELYVGGDAGVMLLNGPVAAGTVVTEQTANGTATSFTFAGFNGTADAGYIVSVGGIDQPPSKYSISNTNGGTITFVEAPLAGELVSVRAIVAGSGSGGSGDATSLQGRSIATTAPTAGQVLAWNATTSKWAPASLNGSVTFNTAGTHAWVVPAWVRYVGLSAYSAAGEPGVGTDGADGAVGVSARYNVSGFVEYPTTGANGADGEARDGFAGKGVQIDQLSILLLGGAAGTAGVAGTGGGGSGGGGAVINSNTYLPTNGSSGNGSSAGGGGGAATEGAGGAAGSASGGGNAGSAGGYVQVGGGGAASIYYGGAGGNGGSALSQNWYGGGGGGGGDQNCGGGGGGGGMPEYTGTDVYGLPGAPGKGGKGTPGSTGVDGQTHWGIHDIRDANITTLYITISEGYGNASVTITY